MARDGHQNLVGIPRIDGDLRYLLAIAQAKMGPGLAGVGRFVNAVSHGKIRTVQPFPATDINHVRIRNGDGNCADGASRLVVEDRVPGAPVVSALPDPAIAHADVEDVGLAGHAGGSLGTSAPKRPNRPPVECLGEIRDGLLGQRPGDNDNCKGKYQTTSKQVQGSFLPESTQHPSENVS